VFHPEASKVAYMASGGRRGLAQSIFQVGGNAGSSLGPLLAALIIVPYGKSNILWFSVLALLAIVVLITVGRWYKSNTHRIKGKSHAKDLENRQTLSKRTITFSVIILLVLIFSKYFYLACISSYYTFFLIDKFHVSVQSSQVHLFIFLFAVAAGTLLGGPLGDKFGRKYVIWFSILGAAPFTLLLPYVPLFGKKPVNNPIKGRNAQTLNTYCMLVWSASIPNNAEPIPPMPNANPKNKPAIVPTLPGINSCA